MTQDKKNFQSSSAADIISGMPSPASATLREPSPSSETAPPPTMAVVRDETIQRLRHQLEELRARETVGHRKRIKQQKADFIEPRSRRISLMVRPALYDSMDRLAELMEISVNNLIERAVTEYIQRHGNQLGE